VRHSLLIALLCLGGCGVEETTLLVPAPAPGPAPVAKTPVKGASLTEQGFDTTGDGMVDTWRRLDPSTGTVIVARDTDGDGVVDTLGEIETSKEPPPGVIVQEGDDGAAMEEIDTPHRDNAPDGVGSEK
jgi:hypothetical protein